MESSPKELRAAAEAIYAKPPGAAYLSMYGGEASDYLPDIEVSSATVEAYEVFVDLETQWRVNNMNGIVIGLDYSALPIVLLCHGIKENKQILRDIRTMEAAAIKAMNTRES